MGIINVPEPKLPKNEFKKHNALMKKFDEKLQEYQRYFDDSFTTENLCMPIEEIIENIDKCLKHNRKWDGYIVPAYDYDDIEI